MTSSFFFQAEDGIRDLVRSRGLGDVYKRQLLLRVKKGVYYIIPYEQDPETFMPDWHLLAQYILSLIHI